MSPNKEILYIDCFSGISGDMLVAALLDLGAGSLGMLKSELSKIDISGWSITVEKVQSNGISASHFMVDVTQKQEPRSLSEIDSLLAGSRLDENIRSHALSIFHSLARAEAEAHGESLDTVHFHEVGMVDSIIDIVGACILIEDLAPIKIFCSPIVLGSGTVETSHGPMPVPAPATALLLKDIPVLQGDEKEELTTPTGASLVTYFADSFGPLPPLRPSSFGYGAGTRKTRGPNILRLIKGKGFDYHDDGGFIEQQILLEANIDDCNPEQLAYLTEKLLKAGAVDAWLTPIVMKKGRAGVILCALCPPSEEEKYLDLIFTESSTFGVRMQKVDRHCLERHNEVAETLYGAISVKIGIWRGNVITVSPEYEDCRREAEKHRVPINLVYDAAREAAKRSIDNK